MSNGSQNTKQYCGVSSKYHVQVTENNYFLYRLKMFKMMNRSKALRPKFQVRFDNYKLLNTGGQPLQREWSYLEII